MPSEAMDPLHNPPATVSPELTSVPGRRLRPVWRDWLDASPSQHFLQRVPVDTLQSSVDCKLSDLVRLHHRRTSSRGSITAVLILGEGGGPPSEGPASAISGCRTQVSAPRINRVAHHAPQSPPQHDSPPPEISVHIELLHRCQDSPVLDSIGIGPEESSHPSDEMV